MNEKSIIVGEISEDYYSTPIYIFKKAIELSKQDEFQVHTNNPQLVEALEVLCGEDNVKVYLTLNGLCKRITFLEAYNYLGDVYDIIDRIRGFNLAGAPIDEDELSFFIEEYNKKYSKKVEGK